MKNKNVIFIVIGVVMLISAIYFVGKSGFGFSITGDERIEIPYSCSVPDDCVTNMVTDGATTSSELEYFQSQFDIVCESEQCFGVRK